MNIIYLMGAGRSGTTALATFLGNNDKILTVGEMHQFFEHIENNKNCSCGKSLFECEFWSKVLEKLPEEFINNAKEYREFCEKFEYHNAIMKHFFNKFSKQDIEKYINIQNTIFSIINEVENYTYILDSAKYIGRVLSLRKSSKLNIKTIYVIRDVRGVINSFSKSVQTPRKPLSTIIYWNIINLIGEIVFRIYRKNSIKLKYEDFINNPIEELSKLEQFLEINLSDIKNKINNQDSFYMPHIIGGNRLKSNKKIKFQKDISWKQKYSKIKKLTYYCLGSPIMLLNRFKV